MPEKYPTALHYAFAHLVRARTRSRLAGLVDWEPLDDPQDGCTAIVGIHRAMPDVLVANLKLLADNASETITSVIACVDGPEGCMSQADIERAREVVKPLPLEVHYYTQEQSDRAEALLLPYVYAWLSWCVCLKHVKTRHALIHDFDALILDGHLADRYRKFCQDDALIQCISWYDVNGIDAEDRLATTFEALIDVAEFRKFDPRDLFNQVGTINGKRVDFDILLAIQAKHYPEEKRTVMPVSFDMLVHPSQMIHQYTMFRRQPGDELPCYSIILLPFFSYLGGAEAALETAADAIENMTGDTFKFVAEDPLINLNALTVPELHWAVKQMLQVLWRTNREISPGFRRYVSALYARLGLPVTAMLDCDIDEEQRKTLNETLQSADLK